MSCSARTVAITAKAAVVSINGVVVPRDAIAREVQHHAASSPAAAWKEAARALAVRELLLQKARRIGGAYNVFVSCWGAGGAGGDGRC